MRGLEEPIEELLIGEDTRLDQVEAFLWGLSEEERNAYVAAYPKVRISHQGGHLSLQDVLTEMQMEAKRVLKKEAEEEKNYTAPEPSDAWRNSRPMKLP
jgi:hypothetical protein